MRACADMVGIGRRDFGAGILALIAVPLDERKKMRGKSIEQSGTSYSQAYLVEKPDRLLFVSGQVPADARGDVPTGFDEQCRLVWRNIETRLAAADMGLGNLVKITIFLSDRNQRERNTAIRHEVLGGHSPAITVIIADIFDEAWLLEIEAIACA